MKKHNFKPKKIKINEPIAGTMTICATCKKGMWEAHNKEWFKTFEDAQEHNGNYPIKKLTKREDSLNGPPYERYFLEDIANKINEMLEWINQHEKEN